MIDFEPCYKDRVRVKAGFYRGYVGDIYSHYNGEYLLTGSCGKWFHASELEKVPESSLPWYVRMLRWENWGD